MSRDSGCVPMPYFICRVDKAGIPERYLSFDDAAEMFVWHDRAGDRTVLNSRAMAVSIAKMFQGAVVMQWDVNLIKVWG